MAVQPSSHIIASQPAIVLREQLYVIADTNSIRRIDDWCWWRAASGCMDVSSEAILCFLVAMTNCQMQEG
jgi:hypothetical protein